MKTIGTKWWAFLLGIAGSLLLTAAWGAQLQQGGTLPGGRTWAPARGEVVTSVFVVDNLSCSVSLDTIGSELQGVQGTVGLDADLASQVIFVDHQEDLNSDKIAEKITAAGYPARLLGSGRRIRAPASAGSVPESAAGRGSGCNRRACGATAREWKLLYQRYFAK